AEPGAQLVEHDGAGMHLAPLDARDHRPADAGAGRDLLQRQPQAGPPLRDAAADEKRQGAFDGIHYMRVRSLIVESSVRRRSPQHFFPLSFCSLPTSGSCGMSGGSRTPVGRLVKLTLIVTLLSRVPAGNAGARIAVSLFIHMSVSLLNAVSP